MEKVNAKYIPLIIIAISFFGLILIISVINFTNIVNLIKTEDKDKVDQTFTNKPVENIKDEKILSLRNEFSNESYLSAIDIDLDGIDELIYESRGWSIYHPVYILKVSVNNENNLFQLFCDTCYLENVVSTKMTDGKVKFITPTGEYKWTGTGFIEEYNK